MMLDRLEVFVAMMRGAGIVSLSVCEGGETLDLRLHPQVLPGQPLMAPLCNEATVKQPVRSPEMGRFRPLDRPAGRHVASGEILGYIEIECLKVSVIAPAAGWIESPLHEDDAVVGYGEVLFVLSNVAPSQ